MKSMKKCICKIVAACFAVCLGITSFAVAAFAVDVDAAYSLGDVTGDSKVTSADARLVLRSAAKLCELSPEEAAAGDINHDHKVNSSDARIMLRIAAKLVDIRQYTDSDAPVPDDPIEVNGWLGRTLDSVRLEVSGLYYDSDLEYYRTDNGLYLGVREENGRMIIWDIILETIDGSCDYTLFGAKPNQGSGVFAGKGFSKIAEDFYVSDRDPYLCLIHEYSTEDGSHAYSYYRIDSRPPEYSIELSGYMDRPISQVLNELPGLMYDPEDDVYYSGDGLFIYTVYINGVERVCEVSTAMYKGLPYAYTIFGELPYADYNAFLYNGFTSIGDDYYVNIYDDSLAVYYTYDEDDHIYYCSYFRAYEYM